MIDQERYEELKDQMVWVKFCHADPNVRQARYRESSRVEIEPVLVKLSDAIQFITEPEWYEHLEYDPKLGVDSSCYWHGFATNGYPTVKRDRTEVLQKLKEMGHGLYSRGAISYDVAHIKPSGEPEEEVTAPLIELWIGEYKHETQDLGMYTGKTYSQQQIQQAHKDVEEATKSVYMDYDEYQQLKDQKVWVRFCHADSSVRAARDRENSRVEYEPILVRLEDALRIIPESEWRHSNPYQFSPEQSVDSSYYSHGFATPGYPVVDRMQKGIIRELKGMGHEIYQRNAISYDVAHIKPAGEPEVEVTAPLIEIWFGEYEHETKKFGLYTGKAYSQQQIDEAHADVEKAREMLDRREIVSPEAKSSFEQGNFDEIAETLGVEEGELVWRRYSSQRYTGGDWNTEDLGIAKVIRTDRDGFELAYPFGFPYFSADQKELQTAIESLGAATLEHHGRSGLASRNSYTVKPKEKTTEYDIKVIDEMRPAYKGTRYMTERKNIQTIDYCQEDVERAYEMFAQAKESIRTQRLERFMSKFREKSLDGVFSIISEGGYEEKVEIPEGRFIECFRMRTANTQDYRQNRTHTDDVGYIDIEKAKSLARNGKLHINLPEEYMGKMIGAKGSNIKRLQEVLGQMIGDESSLKIILHAKTKEEVEIRLAQIQNAIEEQKAKSHEE